jgi:hypothetical protein
MALHVMPVHPLHMLVLQLRSLEVQSRPQVETNRSTARGWRL